MKTLKKLFPTVTFGTSGVRALVADLNAQVVEAYVTAFVHHLRNKQVLPPAATMVVGIDLRPSSPVIAASVCHALQQLDCVVEYAGQVPTPALALRCIQASVAGIMVTGSHIPFDRNGIKFYSENGEILKEDEIAIASSVMDQRGLGVSFSDTALPQVDSRACETYMQRYRDFFGTSALQGLRVGLYEHSAVGREITRSILESLGATVVPLGRSDAFVPIDTEAVGDADLLQAQCWCSDYRLDALVSTDGDGDRPLVFDERGSFVQGDLLGLLCAHALGIRALAVPVSCNTVIERCGAFDRVLRTRIGSPYVIVGMNALAVEALSGVAGFEANGGFLLGTKVISLDALPTRDAMLPIITILASAVRSNQPVSALVAELPQRFTHCDRIKEVPSAASAALLTALLDYAEERMAFFIEGNVAELDTTDGLRVTFVNGDIVHLRPSGNAPELRCYAEADSWEQARALVQIFLGRAMHTLVPC